MDFSQIPERPHLVAKRERRYKLLSIAEEEALAFFSGQARITNLPPGTELDGVGHDYTTGCFLLRMVNPEFEPVRVGELLPILMSEISHGKVA